MSTSLPKGGRRLVLRGLWIGFSTGLFVVVVYRLDQHAWPHSRDLWWIGGLTFLGGLGIAGLEGRVRRRRATFAALAAEHVPDEQSHPQVSASRVGRVVLVGRINRATWFLAAFALLTDLLGTLAVGYFHPETTTPDRVGLGLLLGVGAGSALVLASSRVVAVGPDLMCRLFIVRRSVAGHDVDRIRYSDGPVLVMRNGREVDLSWVMPLNPRKQREFLTGFQSWEEVRQATPSRLSSQRRWRPDPASVLTVVGLSVTSAALTLAFRFMFHH